MRGPWRAAADEPQAAATWLEAPEPVARRAHRLGEAVRSFALGLPEAWEDHPWGDTVVKVGTKIFVFLGAPDGKLGFTVKLPHSADEALAFDWTSVPGYGLDRGRWVTVHPPDDAPVELLTGWIEESYRAVAPKRLVAALDKTSSG